MGARPSSFKRGGGYLNGVDAAITGYSFLVGETSTIKNGDRKGEDFTPLSLVPSFRVDGADVDQSQRLLIGEATFFGEVSDDGLTLATPAGQSIGANTEAGLFIASLVEAGFPEENFSDSDDEINFAPMVGSRVHLVQVVNVEKTKRQGQQTGKDGKKYDLKDLKVKAVLSVGTGAPKAAGKSAKPAAGKAAKVVETADVAQLSADVLLAILNDAKVCPEGTILRAKLPVQIAKKTASSPHKDAIRKTIYSDEFLTTEAGWAYDKDDPSQTITLV